MERHAKLIMYTSQTIFSSFKGYTAYCCFLVKCYIFSQNKWFLVDLYMSEIILIELLRITDFEYFIRSKSRNDSFFQCMHHEIVLTFH